jgi:hypothetical protein
MKLTEFKTSGKSKNAVLVLTVADQTEAMDYELRIAGPPAAVKRIFSKSDFSVTIDTKRSAKDSERELAKYRQAQGSGVRGACEAREHARPAQVEAAGSRSEPREVRLCFPATGARKRYILGYWLPLCLVHGMEHPCSSASCDGPGSRSHSAGRRPGPLSESLLWAASGVVYKRGHFAGHRVLSGSCAGRSHNTNFRFCLRDAKLCDGGNS